MIVRHSGYLILIGVKTIDPVHNAGFSDGSIGFQLCHAGKHTVVDVKALYIRTRKKCCN